MRKWQRSGAAAQQAGTVLTPMPGRIVKVTAVGTSDVLKRIAPGTNRLLGCSKRLWAPALHGGWGPRVQHWFHTRCAACLQVFVAANDSVDEGDALVQISAMKMVHTGEGRGERKTAPLGAG